MSSPRTKQLRGWMDAWLSPRPEGWRDPMLALLLAALYVVLLLSTVADLGYARDEGFYFDAARSYQRWFELLWSDAGRALQDVDKYWRVNHEHPALIKSLFALSHLFLFKKYKLFAMEGTSFRFAAMLLSSLGVGLVYLWGARARGRLVGLVAAGSLAAMPRFFFHAHLACFDAPVVTMWTLCAYTYWRAMQRGGTLWPLLVGLSFGLALNTKHNSWFLPIVCSAHALILLIGGVKGVTRKEMFKRALAALGSMAVIGPLLFYATWPWIWHHTAERLQAYAMFHLRHVYYNMEFLGQNYFEPPMPRSYAFVMTAATVPAITLLCFAVGLALSGWRGWLVLRGRERTTPKRAGERRALEPRSELLWLLALAVQYAAWLKSTTPIFGGTKHWMTAYPFLALIAGIGVAAAARRSRLLLARGKLRPLARSRALEPALLGCVLVAPIVQAAHVHPWGLSSYNVLVGGAPGGANLGLNRGFWGYTTGSVTGYLNASAPKRARVYVHDTAGPSWQMLKRDGRLRRDIRGVWSVAGAGFGLYHHEKHMSGQEYQNWVAFGTAVPDEIAGLDGVPVIWVYRSPTLPKPP